MSVARSHVSSTVPTEPFTVIGSRGLRRGDDEAYTRSRCVWFERKLHLEDYRRDKRNEERCDSRNRYVRINSKRLHCSYEIPAEECHRFLKRLRELLAPGFRAVNRSSDERKRDKHLDILYDWSSCSDFTAQVIPKAPTVIWLDIDCVRCKNDFLSGSEKTPTSRHVKSLIVIETVLSVVAEKRVRDTDFTHEGPDLLYVTRGRTCGMHMFFPQIVVREERHLEEVWYEVNRLLKANESTAATVVDTGCSAMPLPLAREHNGLTRISFEGQKIIKRSHVLKPSLKDLASVTAFFHFLAEDFKSGEENVSPEPSEVGGKSTATSSHTRTSEVSECDVPKPVVGSSNRTVDPATTTVECDTPLKEKSITGEIAETDGRAEEVATTGDDHLCPVASDVEEERGDRGSVVSNNSATSSNASSSKRGLVQTSLRELYEKMEQRKRKCGSSSSTSSSSPKRSRVEGNYPVVVLDDGEDERAETTGGCSKPNDSGDEAASSFLFAGYGQREGASANASSHVAATDTLLGRSSLTAVTVSVVTDTSTSGPSVATSLTRPIADPYVSDETVPPDARVPVLCGSSGIRRESGQEYRKITRAREDFGNNMKLTLDGQENQTHETDVQFLLSSFSTEMDFYTALLKDSEPLVVENGAEGTGFDGLRTKDGCSLHDRREICPPAMFPEHMPYVLHKEDFVTESDWIRVLVRYFDEYLNNAPFLIVMSYVLRKDENVTTRLSEATRLWILRHVESSLSRFKYDAIALQKKNDARRGFRVSVDPKHPYEDKCAVVTGLVVVCSSVFEMKTPVFTDFTKACRLLLVNNQQTLDSLNTSTMSTAGSSKDGSDGGATDESLAYDSFDVTEEDRLFDESVSRAGMSDTSDETSRPLGGGGTPARVKCAPAHIGNNHAVLASLLRWNYTSLADQTLWCMFFYYYHVHTDALERIVDETMHGGLMVTAVLQAYFECLTRSAPIDVRTVCAQVYVVERALKDGDDQLKCHDNEDDRSLMPPPTRSGGNNRKRAATTNDRDRGASPSDQAKKQQYASRNQNSKKAQRRFQEARDGVRDDNRDGEGETAGGASGEKKEGADSKDNHRHFYKTSFSEVLSMVIRRYLRPMSFDETTVVYTESGYDQGQNEFASAFAGDKDMKRHVMDVFHRSTLKYSMPHGDLLMYNTDVMGTIHRRSACTNNLVLNVFENMYGGCMSYLTRRYSNHLKLYNRFNGDAYRLVVECRHAMNGLVHSIDLSYLNLILRQPIVPPILEDDITVRHMFMREDEMMKGAFVCLNAMDYVRAINMFTRHTRSTRKNCQIVESFLDRLATGADRGHDTAFDADEEALTLFRTTFLFYLLYVFEVLYKIRHAYRRDGSYSVSVERLSWELDVRVLLKLFFGGREFKAPRGLSPEIVRLFESPADAENGPSYSDVTAKARGYGVMPVRVEDEDDDEEEDDTKNGGFGGKHGSAGARCINTRPVVSTLLPDKMSRMVELFGKKGLTIMKSYAPLVCDSDGHRDGDEADKRPSPVGGCRGNTHTAAPREDDGSHEGSDRVFLNMTQAQLEEALYSADKWYDNCNVRVNVVRAENREETNSEKVMDTCMDATSMDTFLRTQLRVHIDNNRLAHIERAVRRDKRDFHFCTHLPLRMKMTALVLATHTVKRLTSGVAEDFCRKEYRLERDGVLVMRPRDGDRDDEGERPDQEWTKTWNRLLSKRERALACCRALADSYFPESYFAGLQPDNTYAALYNYMLGQPKYVTLHALQQQPWAKEVCTALNYLLVINGYDPELVELCLRLFLGFEWPGQWAKRIFVWKSNSNAGKSFFFEHVLRKAFDQSTCINDPKGGKENAPEKSEYYKNFVLMINEFSTASACELKKLCSTSSYKFRMNFGNQMIQAFMVGKLVFNCNTLPATTDHATIQRVALVPLPFWFQKRQTIVESMLNWTRGQCPYNEYEKRFKRNVSQLLNTDERRFFLENRETKNEDDLFNRPNEISLQLLTDTNDQNELVKASMFQVQNKTSQVYMASCPPINTIVGGIVTITRYFCRFRFFNNIKEPVDYSVLPSACNAAAREWQRISQPYFEWKERYRVQRDSYVRTKVSAIYASLNHFAKNHSKSTSFFDLRQFFEWDFAEQKIPYYNAKEDEYNVRLDPQD